MNQVAFSNFESFRSQFSALDLKLVPLRSGPFSGCSSVITGDGFNFVHGKMNSDHRYRGTSHKSHVLLGMHLAERGVVHFGSNVAMQGDMSVLQPRREHWGRVGGMFEYSALSIDPDELAALSTTLVGSDVLLKNQHIHPPSDIGVAARTILLDLTKTVFESEVTEVTARLEALKRSLLYPYLLVAAYGNREGDGLAFEPNSNIVRRAEAWIDSEQPTGLHIIDLCRALRYSLRTVQRAFYETLGIGPARYLKLYRLSKAREVLLKCDPMFTRVSEVALDFGFWELGRFAYLYYQTYGEKPSETLRRRR